MDNKLQKAIQLFQSKKYTKSLSVLKKINASKPTYTSLELEGVCLIELKNIKLATIKFEKSLSLSSNFAEKTNAINNLAAAYLRLQNWALAAKYLEEVIALEHASSAFEARFNLVKCYYNLSNYERLHFHADKLKTVSGFDTEAYCFKVIALLCLGLYQETIDTLNFMYQHITNYPIEKLILITQLIKENLTSTELDRHISIIEQAFGNQTWVEKLKQPSSTTKQKSTDYQFPHIKTSSPEIHSVLTNICEKTIALGGKFVKGLTLIENSGQLSIELQNSDKLQQDAIAISVPLTSIPLLDDFIFTLNGDNLNASPKALQLNPNANELMQLFISLYNLTNKIAHWRQTNPLINLNLSDPIINLFTLPISKSHAIQHLSKLSGDELTIKTFFGSREFNYEQKHLEGANIKVSENRQGLLGIIDLLNHNANAPGYTPSYNERAIQVKSFTDNNNQLCVKYNSNDPLTTYFVYGYIDQSSMKAISIPLTATLSNGYKIFIDNLPKMNDSNKLDDNIKDLEELYPEYIESNNSNLALSRVVFPDYSNRNSLTRVLTHILNKYINRDTSEYNIKQIDDLVNQLISHIKIANLAHWQEVKNLLIHSQKKLKQYDELLKLCEMNITLYESY